MHKIMRDAKHAAEHMVESHPNLYQHIMSGGLNLCHHATEIHHRVRTTTDSEPSAQPFNALTSGTSSDFKIADGEVLTRMTLELTLKTGEGYTSTFVRPTLDNVLECIDDIEIRCNGNTTSICSISSDDLRVAFSELPETKYLRAERALCGVLPGESSTNYLTASDSRKCYINIARNFLVDNKIFTSGLSTDIVIRVNWNGKCDLGTKGVSIGNVRMLLENYHYDEIIRERLLTQSLSGPKLDFRFMKPNIQVGEAVPVTPNKTFQIKLDGVAGMITDLVVIARIAGETVYLTVVVLKDGGKKDVLGSSALTPSYVSDVVEADSDKYYINPDSTVLDSDKYFRVPNAESSRQMGQMGAVSGYVNMDSKHTLDVVYTADDNVKVDILFTILFSCISTFSIDQRKASIVSTGL